MECGATEIPVANGHGVRGVNHLLLDSRTVFVRGIDARYTFALDGSFDAMSWISHHAKVGSELAHLPHARWFDMLDRRIDGASVGESGEMAMCGIILGIPSIFASRDEAFARDAQAFTPGIETVSVKRDLVPGSGDERGAEECRDHNGAAVQPSIRVDASHRPTEPPPRTVPSRSIPRTSSSC